MSSIKPATLPQNFHRFAGDDFTLVFNIDDAAGVDANLTGLTWEWRLARLTDGVVVLTKTSAAGAITVSGSDVSVAVDGADTAALLNTYKHQLRATDAGGDALVVAWGFGRFDARLVDA